MDTNFFEGHTINAPHSLVQEAGEISRKNICRSLAKKSADGHQGLLECTWKSSRLILAVKTQVDNLSMMTDDVTQRVAKKVHIHFTCTL